MRFGQLRMIPGGDPEEGDKGAAWAGSSRPMCKKVQTHWLCSCAEKTHTKCALIKSRYRKEVRCASVHRLLWQVKADYSIASGLVKRSWQRRMAQCFWSIQVALVVRIDVKIWLQPAWKKAFAQQMLLEIHNARCSQPLALCNQLCMKRHERPVLSAALHIWNTHQLWRAKLWLCGCSIFQIFKSCLGRGCSHLCEKNCHEGSCGQCEAKVKSLGLPCFVSDGNFESSVNSLFQVLTFHTWQDWSICNGC